MPSTAEQTSALNPDLGSGRFLAYVPPYPPERAAPDDLLDVTSRICGLHAQVASAAELSAWVRMHPGEPGAVSAALWQDRTLVKTWAMRGTLHLIVATSCLSIWPPGAPSIATSPPAISNTST